MVFEARPGLPKTRISSASQLVAKHLVKPGAAQDKLGLAFGYTHKPRSGSVVIGSSNEFVGFDTSNTPEVLARIKAVAERLMPAIAELNLLRTWAGLRPYSASGPIIGRAGGPDGYLAATGHGGDGLSLAPITGRYVAEMIARDAPELGLDEFLSGVAPGSP